MRATLTTAIADGKTDRAKMAEPCYTTAECVVQTDSPEGSTLLDAGSSGQTDTTL